MEIKSIDQSAFDAIYEENAEKVYRIALYFSGDHHAAEDITQTVFMKLCANMEHINPDRIVPWVKITAKHMALNYRRHAEYEVDFPFEDMESLIDNLTCEESVEEFLERYYKEKGHMELTEKVFADLYQKNPRWYEAVTITYILEEPQSDVAETMGISIGSLRTMLHRAKNWIRKQYQKQLDHLKDT